MLSLSEILDCSGKTPLNEGWMLASNEVSMRNKRNGANTPGELAKGQLWKLSNFYIQIVELGKRLIHYRMLSDVKETGARIKTSSIEVMWGYLKSRRARLVHNGSSAD